MYMSCLFFKLVSLSLSRFYMRIYSEEKNETKKTGSQVWKTRKKIVVKNENEREE